MQTPFRSLPVVKATTWCLVPSLPHLSEALGISFSTLQTHPLSSFVHSSSTLLPSTHPSLYPLTDSQIISPHRMPPSDIHSTDMHPSPWLWPSSDHEPLFRGQNKRRLQRLQRIFRAKRNRRLWIYFMSLFQLHGFHIIIKKKKVTLTKCEHSVWRETWFLSQGKNIYKLTTDVRVGLYTLVIQVSRSRQQVTINLDWMLSCI